MNIILVHDRDEALTERLLNVWERSVKATHLFLTKESIQQIKMYVPQAIDEIEHLVVAVGEDNETVAFMGVENRKLEMLFVDSAERAKGIGKQLVQYGIEKFSINEVTVNEQNPQAIGFYEHLGFKTYKRTDIDEQGNPYPLLYMELLIDKQILTSGCSS